MDTTVYTERPVDKPLSPIVIEELRSKTKSATKEQKRVMLSVLPTEMLVEEITRRKDITDKLVNYISDFSELISGVEDDYRKQSLVRDFKKNIEGGFMKGELPIMRNVERAKKRTITDGMTFGEIKKMNDAGYIFVIEDGVIKSVRKEG